MMRQFGAALLVAAGLLGAGAARADTFVLSNTTRPNGCGPGISDDNCKLLDGNGYVVANPDGSTTLVGSDEGNPGPSGQPQQYGAQGPFNRTSYLATALQDETLVFSFKYLSLDDFSTVHDPASMDINSVRTQISVSLPEHGEGVPNDPQFGSVTFSLTAGDVYGFDIFTDSRDGAGYLTFELTDATYPNGVPEPKSWALLVAGFGGLGAALRKKRPLPSK